MRSGNVPTLSGHTSQASAPQQTPRRPRRLKPYVIGGGMFVLGIMLGSAVQTESSTGQPVAVASEPQTVTKTITKEVTPSSCTDVIELDNTIFTKIGDALGSYPDVSGLDAVTAYINDNIAQRAANIADCTSH